MYQQSTLGVWLIPGRVTYGEQVQDHASKHEVDGAEDGETKDEEGKDELEDAENDKVPWHVHQVIS